MEYRIRLKGHLEGPWTDWFGGLAVTIEPTGDTVLSGPVADQAALHGVLRKVRDLCLTLVSVDGVDPPPTPDRRVGQTGELP